MNECSGIKSEMLYKATFVVYSTDNAALLRSYIADRIRDPNLPEATELKRYNRMLKALDSAHCKVAVHQGAHGNTLTFIVEVAEEESPFEEHGKEEES